MAPLHRRAVPKPASELEQAYTSLIRQAGPGGCTRVVRILPPCDSDGEAEVLYLDGDGAPMTAYITDDKDAAPLIAVGW